MMTLREAILDALADGGESIIQIKEYLEYLGIVSTKDKVVEMLGILLNEQKIMIAYPKDVNIKSLSAENIDDLWFELTDIGRCEWEQIT